MLCPSGTYKQKNLCKPCLPGTYNPYEDQLKCKPCPKSTYNPNEGQIFCITAENGGYTNTHVGAINRTDCPPGSYNSNVGFGIFPGNGTACTFCPPASYNPYSGKTECTIAPNGVYTNFEIGATNYTECPPGSYNSEVGFGALAHDATACPSCPPASYNPYSGQTKCTPAPNGGYTNLAIGATNYTQCLPGYYNEGVGFGTSPSQATACTLAPINYYTNYSGATAPVPCPDGYMSTMLGSTNCTILNTSIVSNASSISEANANTSMSPATAGMLGGVGGGAAMVGGMSIMGCITYCLAQLFPGPIEFVQGLASQAIDFVQGMVVEKAEKPVFQKTKYVAEKVKGFGKKIWDKSHRHDANNQVRKLDDTDKDINWDPFENFDSSRKKHHLILGDNIDIEMPLRSSAAPLLDASNDFDESSSESSTSSSSSNAAPPYQPTSVEASSFSSELSGRSDSQDDTDLEHV